MRTYKIQNAKFYEGIESWAEFKLSDGSVIVMDFGTDFFDKICQAAIGSPEYQRKFKAYQDAEILYSGNKIREKDIPENPDPFADFEIFEADMIKYRNDILYRKYVDIRHARRNRLEKSLRDEHC
jgi:hypothetical protein